MLRLARIAIVALFAAMLVNPAAARAPEWVQLGEHRVELFETDDEIRVGRDDGVFTRIRLEVNGNDLNIRYMRVRFLNGQEQTINIDRTIREGRSTPEFDLVGRHRGIQSIFLRYNGRPLFGGKARIKVFGLRTDFDPPPPPPPPPSAGRGKVLDTQVVRTESDRIEFDVGREQGMITQIRLRSVDGPLLYRAIEITFGNGEVQTIEGIERLEPGEQGKAIDLSGDRRFIKKVVVYKRPSWRPGQSTVELLGLVEPRPAPPPPPRPIPPLAGDFDLIDQQVVDKRADRVEFIVPRGDGPFSQIKFKAIDDGILFRSIEIYSRGGQVQRLDIIERLEPGEESPAIDVEGRGDIERVVVTKRPSWRPGEARLALAGRERPRAPPPPPPPAARPPGHGFPPGWVLIEAKPIERGRLIIGNPLNPDRSNRPPPGAGTRGLTAKIPVGREVGQFSRIGLRLMGDAIRLNSLTIIYGNGEPDRIAVGTELGDRARTQPIDLKGRDRFIREVVLDYDARPGGKTVVELYGDYADGWLGDRGRRRDFNQGWVLLGAQRAAMFGSGDVDAFQIGERYGRFSALKVTSRDHAVRFYGLRIIYGNGEVEDVPFSGELSGGQSSPKLDLKGRQRFIDRIEMKYRTKLNFQGDGVVEVWGMQ